MSIRHLSSFAAILFFFSWHLSLHAQTGANTLTWHNNVSRTGANAAETTLTLGNVNSAAFGKVNFFSLWGAVDAQPLYVAGVNIGGSTHNVLYVATEHNRVYALDAETGNQLWKAWAEPADETSSDNHGCSQISPEIGVTSTPVIDLSAGPHGVIYVVSMTKDAAGDYHQKISALDLTTGALLFGSPVNILASYTVGGKTVSFDPAAYADRAALLEWNGSIYTAWTSHCDAAPYTGWIIGYSASTLEQTNVLNVTPNGSEGAIWMGGAGLAATPSTIYFLDANGSFDTALDGSGYPENHDYGNAFIKLALNSQGALQISDYYATDNTVEQSSADVDLGSGGVIVLPTMNDANGNQHLLAVGAGKDGNIYLVNRANMGKYHPNGGYIYQVLSGALPHGEWGAPAYSNDNLYYGGVNDYLRAFTFSNAKLNATPASHSANTFAYPGTTPVVSSNGTVNEIVWAVGHTSPAVLYAYNASDLSQELYDSNQSGTRDQFGSVDHFISPLVANGRVYVPTQTGIAVFGLLGK
jgi:hypothetical protein